MFATSWPGIAYSCKGSVGQGGSSKGRGGGLQFARPLRSGDNWKRNVAPSIALHIRFRAIHHVSCAFLTWPSCCAIPTDVTRTRAGSVVGTRPANSTCGPQHIGPCARAHMGPRAFQSHTIAVILAVHVVVSYQSRDVSTPAPDHGVVRACAVRKTRDGPCTQRPAEPARFQK